MEWLEFAKTFGVPMALVAAFVARDYWREKALTERVQRLESFQHDTLQGLVISVRDVASEATRALRHNTAILKRMGRDQRATNGLANEEDKPGN